MNKNFYIFLLGIFFVCSGSFLIDHNIAYAHQSEAEIKKLKWSFEGALGYYDRAALQRGFQVYNEVCAACHGMDLMTYRKLKDIGFSEEEVKAIAATKTFKDGPNDEGEMFERSGRPSDKFANPYPNKNAAIAANGAYPTDLSLIIKAEAHAGGPNYIYSLLTGYDEKPENFDLPEGKYYNKFYAGNIISMPSPLHSDDLVTYTDGTAATKEQMVKDVTNFLQWVSEPELEERKKMGIKFLSFFVFASIILYLVKKRVWKNVK
jgi:ubiquinol-cytochrome c reductase cytochrome c1 subunit